MTEMDRCAAEIAAAEAELRGGNKDVAGLTRCLVDWRTEAALIEAEGGE